MIEIQKRMEMHLQEKEMLERQLAHSVPTAYYDTKFGSYHQPSPEKTLGYVFSGKYDFP